MFPQTVKSTCWWLTLRWTLVWIWILDPRRVLSGPADLTCIFCQNHFSLHDISSTSMIPLLQQWVQVWVDTVTAVEPTSVHMCDCWSFLLFQIFTVSTSTQRPSRSSVDPKKHNLDTRSSNMRPRDDSGEGPIHPPPPLHNESFDVYYQSDKNTSTVRLCDLTRSKYLKSRLWLVK